MTNKPIILLDATHVCHFHAHREHPLTYKGLPVGVIFGFMGTLLVLARRFESNRFAFAWDSRRSLRKVWFKGYKAKREADKSGSFKDEELNLFRQIVELREKVLPEFGFRNNFLTTGFEADDVMASICYSHSEDEIVLVTSDNDLYQCLSPNRYMYKLGTKKLYTIQSLKDEWGVSPREWVLVKSLAGCPGDEVPGIEGVGNKTAVKYIRGDLNEKTKAYRRIEEGIEDGTVERTKDLVELPFMGMPELSMSEEEFFFVGDFLAICDRYGFRSFIKQTEIWQRNFDMKIMRSG